MNTEEMCCYINKRNGAWLISWCGSLTDDTEPVYLTDCASSLQSAKRIARQGARDFGYVTTQINLTEGTWTLRGRPT